jgi:hypothetical protein
VSGARCDLSLAVILALLSSALCPALRCSLRAGDAPVGVFLQPVRLRTTEVKGLVERLTDSSRQRELFLMQAHQRVMAEELAGFRFTPHICKTSRALAANNKSLHHRLDTEATEKKRQLLMHREQRDRMVRVVLLLLLPSTACVASARSAPAVSPVWVRAIPRARCDFVVAPPLLQELNEATFRPDLKTPCVCGRGRGLRDSAGDETRKHTCVLVVASFRFVSSRAVCLRTVLTLRVLARAAAVPSARTSCARARR